jgi:hypothetical protein
MIANGTRASCRNLGSIDPMTSNRTKQPQNALILTGQMSRCEKPVETSSECVPKTGQMSENRYNIKNSKKFLETAGFLLRFGSAFYKNLSSDHRCSIRFHVPVAGFADIHTSCLAIGSRGESPFARERS